MKIINRWNGLEEFKNVNNSCGIMQTNSKGGYFARIFPNASRYRGLFVMINGEMYKIVDDITSENFETDTLINNATSIEEHSSKTGKYFKYFYPRGSHSLIIQNNVNRFRIDLDIRKSYDTREWGREYSIQTDGDCLIINYQKKTDDREDDVQGKLEFELYIVIKCNKMFPIEEWREVNYEFDRLRNSYPFRRYVYSAIEVAGQDIVITAGPDKRRAIREANMVFKNRQKYMNQEIKVPKKIENKQIMLAYANAAASLSGAATERGILAGFPWFFQYWTRDEAVSLGALLNLNQCEYTKRAILRRLNIMEDDGRVPNRIPQTQRKSADSSGWIFKRFNELYKMPKNKLTKKAIGIAKQKLEYSIEKIREIYGKETFIKNEMCETWMDTDYKGDTREGYRIEIQTLMMNMYKAAFELTEKPRYKEMEEKLAIITREKFYNGELLADGLNDFTIRPNIFLAYYTYPELFTNEEWEKIFDRALKKLWCEWGGISSIDKEHVLFTPNTTGENIQSYHRGDSWYWINNIAAIAMYKVNKNRYKKEVNAILSASTTDILYQGMIGHHSELSSSSEQTAAGGWAQSFSNATYIELADLILSAKTNELKEKTTEKKKVKKENKKIPSKKKKKDRLGRLYVIRKGSLKEL